MAVASGSVAPVTSRKVWSLVLPAPSIKKKNGREEGQKGGINDKRRGKHLIKKTREGEWHLEKRGRVKNGLDGPALA